MTNEEFQELYRKSNDWFNSLTPAQQEAHREEQRRSWVRGEMGLSRPVKKTINPDGSITYHDYISYCLD